MVLFRVERSYQRLRIKFYVLRFTFHALLILHRRQIPHPL